MRRARPSSSSGARSSVSQLMTAQQSELAPELMANTNASTVRPSTAPHLAKKGRAFKKSTRLSIRDIVNRDGGKKPDGMVVQLLKKTRKQVEAKREVYDSVHYSLQSKRDELKKLETTLVQLRKDGAALGLEEFPDPADRLRPVRSISTRPVFSHRTGIDQMEASVETLRSEFDKRVHFGSVYEHMRDRLQHQKIMAEKSNRDLRADIRELSIKVLELKREDIYAVEAVSAAQTRVSKLKEQVEQEVMLWKAEIKDREEWTKKKDKFEAYYTKALERQRDIELDVKGDLGAAEEKRIKDQANATLLMQKATERRATAAIEQQKEEEAEYEAAFAKIGVKLAHMDPSEVVKMCLAQEDIRTDLEMKRAEEEQRMERLQATLAEIKAQEQQILLNAEDRTTNRMLVEWERRLHEAEKRQEAERKEYEYAKRLVQPVRMGLQELHRKILNRNVAVQLMRDEDIEGVSDEISLRVVDMVQDIAKHRERAAAATTKPRRTTFVPSSQAATPRGDSELHNAMQRSVSVGAGLRHGSDPERMRKSMSAELLISPYNVRVRPRLHALAVPDDSAVDPMVPMLLPADNGMDADGRQEGEDEGAAICDRRAMKLASTKLVSHALKAEELRVKRMVRGESVVTASGRKLSRSTARRSELGLPPSGRRRL